MLDRALGKAWGSRNLSNSHRSLMLACLRQGTERPNAEEDMAELQSIVASCETIIRLQNKTNAVQWLTDEGASFPEAVYRYAFETAASMYNAEHTTGPHKGHYCQLPDDFSNSLVNFIKDSHSHIATLNYDGLLSSAFRNLNIFDCESAILIDGFKESTFRRENLFREYEETTSWYLHLHGCPLFSDDKSSSDIRKLSERSIRGDRRNNLRSVGRHIVLTHAKNKPAIIDNSLILRSYWEFLERALTESKEFLIFGYSGNDPHLNRLIAQKRDDKRVRVVEWIGAGPEAERQDYWARQLGNSIELSLLENPLSFHDW